MRQRAEVCLDGGIGIDFVTPGLGPRCKEASLPVGPWSKISQLDWNISLLGPNGILRRPALLLRRGEAPVLSLETGSGSVYIPKNVTCMH